MPTLSTIFLSAFIAVTLSELSSGQGPGVVLTTTTPPPNVFESDDDRQPNFVGNLIAGNNNDDDDDDDIALGDAPPPVIDRPNISPPHRQPRPAIVAPTTSTKKPRPKVDPADDSVARRPIAKCDFDEDGFCDFENDRKADFEWIRRKGKSASTLTGPDRDCPSGDGYYALLDVMTKPTHQVARLRSPLLFSPLECATISFAFFAYGNNLGRLSVKVVSSPNTYDEVFEVIFEQNHPPDVIKRWQTFKKTVALYDAHYLVLFEGESGDGPYGNYAIDDVLVRADTCPPELTNKRPVVPSRGPRPINNIALMELTSTRANNATSNAAIVLSDTAIAAIVIVVILVVVATIPAVVFLTRRFCKKKGLSPLGSSAPGTQMEGREHGGNQPRTEAESNVDYGVLRNNPSVTSTPRPSTVSVDRSGGYDQPDNLGYLRHNSQQQIQRPSSAYNDQNGVRALNDIAISIVDRRADDVLSESSEHPSMPPLELQSPLAVIVPPLPAPPPAGPPIYQTLAIPPPPYVTHSQPVERVTHLSVPESPFRPISPEPPHGSGIQIQLNGTTIDNDQEEAVVRLPSRRSIIQGLDDSSTVAESSTSASSDSSSDDNSSYWSRDDVEIAEPTRPTRPSQSSSGPDLSSSQVGIMTSPDDWSSGDEAEARLRELEAASHLYSQPQQPHHEPQHEELRFAASNASTTMYEYPNAHNWKSDSAGTEEPSDNPFNDYFTSRNFDVGLEPVREAAETLTQSERYSCRPLKDVHESHPVHHDIRESHTSSDAHAYHPDPPSYGE